MYDPVERLGSLDPNPRCPLGERRRAGATSRTVCALGTELFGSVLDLASEVFRELVGVRDDPAPEAHARSSGGRHRTDPTAGDL
jgi:hypothetical protein